MVWAFKLSFVVDILASFGLGDCLGFFEKLGDFSNFLVTLIVEHHLN
jgi:hypothetical protein